MFGRQFAAVSVSAFATFLDARLPVTRYSSRNPPLSAGDKGQNEGVITPGEATWIFTEGHW